jgi:hypothetical protein
VRRSGAGRRQDREIDLPMPQDLTHDGTAEFFAVVCWRHDTMYVPVDEIERGIRTTPTTTIRVAPDKHRYTVQHPE